MRLCFGVCTFPGYALTSHTQISRLFRLNTHSISSIKMALPGIEGFKNVYDILEAVSAGTADDKFKLRRAARKIRLVLMCADSKTMNGEDRAALIAILGLLVTDWDEAEVCCLQLCAFLITADPMDRIFAWRQLRNTSVSVPRQEYAAMLPLGVSRTRYATTCSMNSPTSKRDT